MKISPGTPAGYFGKPEMFIEDVNPCVGDGPPNGDVALRFIHSMRG